MKPLILAAFAVLLCAASASAMDPKTKADLLAIGIDPESKDVIAADADGTITTTRNGDNEEYSLASLAAAKKKNGTLAFIGARTFIRNLKMNFAGTGIPQTQYDPLYLNRAERALVGRKFAEGMLA